MLSTDQICSAIAASPQQDNRASCPHTLAHAAGCLSSPNVVHAAVGLIASILFVAMSLCLSLADGTDMNPLSKNFFASSESRWLWRRAMIKNLLVIVPAVFPNFHRFVVRLCACCNNATLQHLTLACLAQSEVGMPCGPLAAQLPSVLQDSGLQHAGCPTAPGQGLSG